MLTTKVVAYLLFSSIWTSSCLSRRWCSSKPSETLSIFISSRSYTSSFPLMRLFCSIASLEWVPEEGYLCRRTKNGFVSKFSERRPPCFGMQSLSFRIQIILVKFHKPEQPSFSSPLHPSSDFYWLKGQDSQNLSSLQMIKVKHLHILVPHLCLFKTL